jgi:transposase InsO family protein
MDFIVDLPESNGFTSIWVIVDRFNKMAHVLPLATGNTAESLAKSFLEQIWKLHGLPDEIISDRDSRFTARFWTELLERLQVKRKMSSAHHPETDGQTERVNQLLEQCLRIFTNYEQNDWSEKLPMAEFSYNNSVTNATGKTPFYANYGFHPHCN